MRREIRDGFTLVEVLMAILVIGILSAIAISQYMDFGKDAKIAVTTERLNALKVAIIGDSRMVSSGQYTDAGYESHCLGPPSSLSDLITQPGAGACASVYDPFARRGWRGPYVSSTDSSWNKDAWGIAFEYYVAGPPARTIRSCGPDHVCGNSDDISVTF